MKFRRKRVGKGGLERGVRERKWREKVERKF